MSDDEPTAREGLALGLSTLRVPQLRTAIMYWFEREETEAVRLALIDHLGRNASGSDGDPLFRILLTDALNRDNGELQRKKIQAALGIDLREAQPRLDLGDNQFELPQPSRAGQQTLVFVESATFINGDNNMNSDKSSNIYANNVTVGFINTGEIRDSVINNLNVQSDDPAIRALGADIRRFLEVVAAEPTLADDDRRSIYEEAALVTAPDAGDDRPRRAKKFGNFLRGLLAAPGTANRFIEEGSKLIETLSNLGG